MNIKDMAVGVVKEVTSHWSKPGKGKFVSYKEVLNLGLGGMGQQFVMIMTAYLGLSAGNTLLGSTLGLRPMHLQYMAMVQTVLGVFFCILRGKIVDNTRTRYGRFRPYIALMGFPIVLLTAIFIFLPFETMSYTSKLIATFAFAITVSMVSPLFTDTYNELQTVITPNSEERTNVLAINSLIYSFAPTVAYFIIPLLSQLTGGYTDIRTYRYIIVPMAVLGVSLNLFTAFGCKERVVTSQNYVQKVGVLEGVKEIYKNKHWWLRTVAGWIGFLEGACSVIFGWIYIYGTQDMTTYALLNTVLGSASGIAMVITPSLMKRLGNRTLLLVHNSLNVLFVTMMTFTFRIPLLFFIFLYLNSLVNALSIVYNQAMHSEVKDYQQYISGKRMDFMFGVAGLIGTPVTMVTGMVIPYVYECMGLTTNYDILYDPSVRNTMFYILCVLSIIGAILNLIPFSFYSLSREKHRNIIKVLRYRALFDDYENDCLNAEEIVLAIDGIREGYEILNAPMPDLKLMKAKVKEAKALPAATLETKAARNKAIRAARKGVQAGKKLIEQKGAVSILIDELTKFQKPENIRRVQRAKDLVAIGLTHLSGINPSVLDEAKALPSATKEEKALKNDEVKRAKAMLKMAKKIRKNYPDGIREPDPETLRKALDMPYATREESRARAKAVKAAEKEIQLLHTTLKPYQDAQKLVRDERVSRTIYPEIEKMYDNARAEVEQMEQKVQKETAAAGREK
ncbi:MAG: MFS transporter [Candidatus Fimivicinus sp.]|nr:MFS transporter [Oscillospiraceae bacterium]MDY5590713.1 MFS transporter [Candidatus Fimivicinus sp.]